MARSKAILEFAALAVLCTLFGLLRISSGDKIVGVTSLVVATINTAGLVCAIFNIKKRK